MTINLGYVAASSTLYIPFHTFDSNGASITLTGLAVTDIEIYKNGSVTQRASDVGYTLLDTDGIDFDGLTGIHGFSIDLADNTDAGFYSAGAFYWVVVSAVTVDTRTVSFVAATFFIGPVAANATQLAGQTITAGAGVTFPASVASPTNITGGTITTATNVTTVNGLAANVITAASIAADAIDADAIAANAIGASELAADAVTEIQSGLATAAAVATVATQLSTLVSSWTIDYGTIGSTGNDTTHVHIPSMTWGDDELNDHLLVLYDDSAGETHARWISDWVNSSGLATVATLPFTPENATDLFYLMTIRRDVTGSGGLDAAGVRAAVGLASANLDTQLSTIDDFLDTEVAAILADTNELQTDWVNGGRLDLLVDAILEDTGTTLDDFLDTEVAAILTAVDTEVAAIKAKTDLIPTDPADQSAVEAAITAAWTTALTESYRGTGATGTPAQLLYELLSLLSEFSITGATLTTKKLDGSTTAKTYTLNSAATPTGITEAT